MKELLTSCKKMVLDNYTGELDDYILDALSIAILGLHLKTPELAANKLPNILKDLTIFVDDKSLVDIAHDRINNYAEDDFLSDGCIAVTRSLDIDDGVVVEKKYLLADKRRFELKPVDTIGELIHEFTHLIRIGGIENKENDVIIHDGVAFARYSKITEKTTRRHLNVEEGIVQRFTNQTLDLLYEHLQNQDLSEHQLLQSFKKKFPTSDYKNNTYPFQTSIIEYLCQDKGFNDSVDASFEEQSNSLTVAGYYNSVMGSSSAFALFSRNVDNCWDSGTNNNESEFDSYARKLNAEIEKFLLTAKTKAFSSKRRV